MAIANCHTCGATIRREPHRFKRVTHIFCSVECKTFISVPARRDCSYCGKEYIREKSGHRYCSDECRFWSKVNIGDTKDCWLWQGSKRNLDGYGAFMINRKHHCAHRIAWSYANKQPIPEGMLVRHSCDNPRCVNPHHLSIGTNQDNADDRVSRGRSQVPPIGELSGKAKLTWAQVNEIRERFERGGVSIDRLRTDYKVSKTTINSIVKYKTWRLTT